MINPEKQRIENKLKLWETPGFLQFVQDLSDYLGPEINTWGGIHAIKRRYEKKLEELQPKSKFKQGELPL